VQLAQRLRVDVLQLEPVLDAFTGLGWVVQVNETAAGAPGSADARYVLLADPATTHMEPLVQRLLVERAEALERFWGNTGMEVLKLADVLQRGEAQSLPPPLLLKR
jgi:membrane protein